MVIDPKSRTTTEGDTESPIIAEFLLIAYAYTHYKYSVSVAQARGRLLLRLQSPNAQAMLRYIDPYDSLDRILVLYFLYVYISALVETLLGLPVSPSIHI